MELQTERLQRETGATIIRNFVHLHSRLRRVRFVTITSLSEANQEEAQTIALTVLATSCWSPAVLAIDKKLEDHHLMGQTFKEAGFTVRQNRLLRLRLPLLSHRLARLYDSKIWKSSEIECYEFWADEVLYGLVLEIKNPARRQAPARSCRGIYTIHRKLEFAPYTVTTVIARLWGGVIGFCLYIRCFYYVRRLL